MVGHSKILFQFHCIIKLFDSRENLHNSVHIQWAQCIHEDCFAEVACDSCRGMTSKLVPGSITVCSMGPCVARDVKVTGHCRPSPLPAGDCGQRLTAVSELPHSAVPRQELYGSYCSPDKHAEQEGCEISGKYLRKLLKTWIMSYFWGQNDPEIGSLSPMINIHVKVDQIDM